MNAKLLIAGSLLSILPLCSSATVIGAFDFKEGSGDTTYSTDQKYQLDFKHGADGSDPEWFATAGPGGRTGLTMRRANRSYVQLAAAGANPYTNFFDQTLASRTFTVETVFSLPTVSTTDRSSWSILSATSGSRTLFDLSVTYRESSGESTFFLTNPNASDVGIGRLTTGYNLGDYLNMPLYVAISYNGNFSSNNAYRFNFVIGVAGTGTILAQGENLNVNAAWSDVMNAPNATWEVGANSILGSYSDSNFGLLRFYDETLTLAEMMEIMGQIPESGSIAIILGLVTGGILLCRRKRG